jgi:hypothetical protein
MSTLNERGDRADCFVSKFSSKEYLVSTRVAYSVPEQHKLVAQSWYPRQLLAADLAIFESTLYDRGQADRKFTLSSRFALFFISPKNKCCLWVDGLRKRALFVPRSTHWPLMNFFKGANAALQRHPVLGATIFTAGKAIGKLCSLPARHCSSVITAHERHSGSQRLRVMFPQRYTIESLIYSALATLDRF